MNRKLTDLCLKSIGYLFNIVAILAIVYMLIPLLVVVISSFNSTGHIKLPPTELSLDWYKKLFSDTTYIKAILDSTLLAAAATAVSAILGICTALALCRGALPASNAISTLLLSPLILPNIAIGVALLQYASMMGIPRSYTILLAGHVVICTPYIVRLLLASLKTSGIDLEEASHDLGAGALTTFRYVTLPQIKPALIAGSLFAFVISWVNVELSIFNVPLNRELLPIKIFNYVQYTVDPLIAAVSAITIYIAIFVILGIDMIIGIDRFALRDQNE